MTCLFLNPGLFSPMEIECKTSFWCPPFKILSLYPPLPFSACLSSVPVGVQQEHTDTVQRLRFTLDFALCLMEVAAARSATVTGEQGDFSHLSLLQQQSLVADQISSLSREWR